ncbi:MAG: hypothetical protein K0R15_651 [Clostridiales bacterium]|jgi:predicted DNA-binding transcriptional regulator AlpA|nr:hypothetical protein [Clostridiales bacterium]
MEDEKVIYTVKELKELLGIGINQCYTLINTDQFPIKHIGKKIVIPVKPFKEWLNKKEKL